jgi:uncharacterized protein YdiU (UPF0061 family)
MPVSQTYRPAPCFVDLGTGFFDAVTPARFPQHRLRYRNQRWAERVGLGELDAAEWERHFAAFVPLPDNLAEPLALRYHGHQFRVYNPHLGDGRGFLFAQLIDPHEGRLLDLATKGSGQTPWSREGDGRLTLKGGVREILATEMLEALGVYTSKSFSLFETGESLFRNDEPSPTRASVLVRLSHSHVRFGTFQRLAYEADASRMRRLLDFAVAHYMPAVASGNHHDTPAAFLGDVSRRSASLCASWMVAGFVHGVLNTDNMNITGESFDYGPFRFLPRYDPSFVAAYFDPHGLYAFGRQPTMVRWNLERLAEALALLEPRAGLEAALTSFQSTFEEALLRKVVARLGLVARGPDADATLVDATYRFLAESHVAYDQFFFDWNGGAPSEERALARPAAAHYGGPRFAAFRRILDDYVPSEPARLSLAYYQRERPCGLLIDEVETIWEAIATRDEWEPFEAKLAAIAAMREASAIADPDD